MVVITYSTEPSARELTRQVAIGLERVGLLDALLVDGERWWSLTCAAPCCPPEGTAYDLSGHPLSAEAVFAGMSALPDRDALGEMVQGPAAADTAG